MNKHTPGPWTVADENIDDGLAIEAAGRDGGYVPVAWVPVDYDDRMEREANAALIARAPEMAAEIARLTAERDALASDRDGYVQLLTDENNKLRAEVERLKSVEADYDDHEREMIDLEDDNARLRAENAAHNHAAVKYLVEIDELRAEVERLKALTVKADEAIARQQQDLEEAADRAADCDTLRAQVDTAAEMLREVKARNNTLTARVKELEGALTPFADESLWSGPDHEFVTVKRSDCDRARAVLSASQPAPSALPVLSDEFVRAEMDAMQARENKRLETLFTQPAPSPWRLIETAPTDGTVVLVFAAERDGLAAFQCTAAYHEDAGWCVDELREVTHWMPLPPAPQKEGE